MDAFESWADHNPDSTVGVFCVSEYNIVFLDKHYQMREQEWRLFTTKM